MKNAYIQNFPPHVNLIREGETSDFLHILVTGAVEMYAQWNGKETTISITLPTSTFILAATIMNAPYLMSARTIEKSRIIMIPSSDICDIFDIDVGFARSVVSELSMRYRTMIKRHKDLKLRTSVERLANYFVKQRELLQGADRFALPIEKRKLAALLGMTPENLSRAIKTLSQHGLAMNGHIVNIEDFEKLKDFAKPSILIDDPKI